MGGGILCAGLSDTPMLPFLHDRQALQVRQAAGLSGPVRYLLIF
jgi:hypothetical protein